MVEFYATWRSPCKTFAPVFAELAAEYGPKLDFIRIDIDHGGVLLDKQPGKVESNHDGT